VIVLIDNYDSFVHNLARYFRRLGQETVVLRNDETDAAAIRKLTPAAMVLSPGPCSPAEAGNAPAIVSALQHELPVLGVCLGHQILAATGGARIVRTAPVHGQAGQITHNGQGLFQNLPSPMQAGRYHSLIVEEESLPSAWRVTARCDGMVMGIEHGVLPLYGVQFHPESVLTPQGYPLLANFLQLAGLDPPATGVPSLELAPPPAPRPVEPGRPATF